MIFFRFFDVRFIMLSYDIELERDRERPRANSPFIPSEKFSAL